MPLIEKGPYRVRRVVLAGAFPVAVIAGIAAFGIIEFARGPQGATQQPPADTARHVFIVLLAAGFASMATIQVVKSLLGLRGLYQHRQIWLWFSDESPGPDGKPDDQAYRQLLKALSMSRSESAAAIFDLPIEQLSAQISSAADFALTKPDEFKRFLSRLTNEKSEKSVPASPAEPKGTAISDLDLHYYVRAGIDSLQATVGYRWRNYVRTTAMWLSGLFGVVIVEASSVPARERGLDVLASLVIGGFISWLARDITAAIERLRG